MLAIERRKNILNMLMERQSVTVTELSKLFDITEETVRRDLEKLEQDGQLKRTYGGAVRVDSVTADLPIFIREVSNIKGKEKIGLKASEIIKDGDTIILDSSTTVLQVAKYIKNKKITVITNSEKVIAELATVRNIKLISTGGTLRANSLSFVGPQAERMMSSYNANFLFMSCGGLNAIKGLTETNELEAEIKKIMIECSQHVILLLDHTKFNKVAFVTISSLSKITSLITDDETPSDITNELKNNNIELMICDNK